MIGIEADYQGANIKADGVFLGTLTNVELERFGTVRGRLGFAWDRFLIYGTGGWAYAAQTEISLGFPFFVSGSQELSGWTAGAGIEWALHRTGAPRSSTFTSISRGRASLDRRSTPACWGCSSGLNVDIIRGGVTSLRPVAGGARALLIDRDQHRHQRLEKPPQGGFSLFGLFSNVFLQAA